SIATELDFADSKAFAMQVCLEELMSNIVRHGTSRSGSKPTQVAALLISIKIDAFVDRTVMTVDDNRRPFDVAQAPANSIDRPLDQLQPGGLGIQLIKSFASNLSYSHTAKGNRVILEFVKLDTMGSVAFPFACGWLRLHRPTNDVQSRPKTRPDRRRY